MKKIHSNIVEVEESDTVENIENWITANTDVIAQNLNLDTWVNVIMPGDLLIFNSPFAMFRFPAKVVNVQENL